MPNTKEIGRSGNDIIDTVLFSSNSTLDNKGTIDTSDDTITAWDIRSQMNVYTLNGADAGTRAEADILSDYGKLGPLNPIDFNWNAEVKATLDQLNSIQSDMSFERVSTYSNDVDITMSATSGTGFFPTNSHGNHEIEGEGIFPGEAQNSAGEDVTHLVVNGNSLSQTVGAAEVGGGHYRNWITTHEFGHDLSLSHPHSRFDAARNTISDFPSGFDLNNEKYTVMSYNGSTPLARDAAGNITGVTYGHSIGYMAVDVAAIQHANGIGSNNTGNTTYNLTDGAQITDPKSNNAALDIDGADESRAELSQAVSDAAKTGGVWEGIKAYGAKFSEQLKSGRLDGGEESIGRAYKTIYDGEREVDAAGNESIGNGGIDEISYAGSQQNAMINLNDAGLKADKTDAQYLDLQREIKGSDRWTEFNDEFQNEIDATVKDKTGTLRSDAYSAGGHFSKLYTTDAAGKVTTTQDGGYSIANGVVIENATGGDKADTLIGNEHDNVLTGNKGADALYGGHGNDTLIGGEGNDALIAGRGNNTLDGGADFDTASYENYYDPAVGVPVTQGVSFSITGHQATVTKPLNGAIPGPAGAMVEIDSLKDVERFEGTDRNDAFTVENLSGNMYISGGQGDDTLTVKDPAGAYTLDMTGGTYPAGHPREGESYTGTVSDGTNTLYLEDKDLTVTIETPAASPAPATKKGAELDIEDAIGILAADQKTLNRQVTETGISTPAHEAINHPDAFQIMGNLHAAGISTLKARILPDMNIEDRVGNILNAGRDATQEAGLLMPHEQREQEAQAELAADYVQPITEPVYEDDNSYSM